MLHDFAREVLRDQPEDIYAYGAAYFRAMEQGVAFEYGAGGQEYSPAQPGMEEAMDDETAQDAMFWENSAEVIAKMGYGTKMPEIFTAMAEQGRLGFGNIPDGFEGPCVFTPWFNTDMGAYQGEVDE